MQPVKNKTKEKQSVCSNFVLKQMCHSENQGLPRQHLSLLRSAAVQTQRGWSRVAGKTKAAWTPQAYGSGQRHCLLGTVSGRGSWWALGGQLARVHLLVHAHCLPVHLSRESLEVHLTFLLPSPVATLTLPFFS